MIQIDKMLLDSLTKQAKESPRKRAHYNLHRKLSDPVQRLCVAIEPETYIRPHRHAEPSTSEVFLLLRGSAILLVFDDSGRITERVQVSAGGPVSAVEITAAAWHTIASLETGSIFFEVKQGPYVQPKGKNIAEWAPEEGQSETAQFLDWYKNATMGEEPPKLS